MEIAADAVIDDNATTRGKCTSGADAFQRLS
jgi:hypothetical protein